MKNNSNKGKQNDGIRHSAEGDFEAHTHTHLLHPVFIYFSLVWVLITALYRVIISLAACVGAHGVCGSCREEEGGEREGEREGGPPQKTLFDVARVESLRL